MPGSCRTRSCEYLSQKNRVSSSSWSDGVYAGYCLTDDVAWDVSVSVNEVDGWQVQVQLVVQEEEG